MRRSDLKHLKYKLINDDGLTPDKANKRIEELIEWENKNNQQKKEKELMKKRQKADKKHRTKTHKPKHLLN